MAQTDDTLYLLADIGGTNTRVALSRGDVLIQNTIRRYRNVEFDGLETVLAAYVAAHDGVRVDAVCVDAAGPVQDGRARLTNLPWDITEDGLSKAFGTDHVAILNDLEAQGYGLEYLKPEDLALVRSGRATEPDATRLVVNIGTGFNATPVFHASGRWHVAKSECGHASMPVRQEADTRLSAYLAQTHGFTAVEDVLSGRGLEHVYKWLAHEAGLQTAPSSAEIMEGCHSGSDPRAEQTVACFTRLFGLVTGDLALTHLPFGGIYLVGGLSSAILPFMKRFDFEAAFLDKGRFSDFMRAFAVHVVEDDYAALKGCAGYLHRSLQN